MRIQTTPCQERSPTAQVLVLMSEFTAGSGPSGELY